MKTPPKPALDACADGLLTIAEAQSFLRIKRSKIYGLMQSGEVPYVKIDGARRIPRRALVRLAARNLFGDLP